MAGKKTRVIAPLCAAIALIAAATSAFATTSSWPTYHLDQGRSGNDTGEPSFANMTSAWQSQPLDGLIVGEPLITSGEVIVTTENDTVWAFDDDTGNLDWRIPLGAPRVDDLACPDFNPMGITSTPILDGGFLYAVDEIQRRV